MIAKKNVKKPIFNENIIAYLDSNSFSIDRKTVHLTRAVLYNSNGFYVRSDNFLEKLPLFVAGTFPYDRWYKADIYSKSYDGQGSYIFDKKFLKKCLIYTCLTPKNKCRSLQGSDGRYYRNELCFDGKDTIASIKLKKINIELTYKEKNLFTAWENVLRFAKEADEYNYIWKYGFWQIKEEINNQKRQVGVNRCGEPILEPKYPYLNVAVNDLDRQIKTYYSEDIIDDLFKYELIK